MIVEMKKLAAIVPYGARRATLRALYRMGCVELESNTGGDFIKQYSGLLRLSEENTGAADERSHLQQAAASLAKYAPKKTSMLTPRQPITEEQLFDKSRLQRAEEKAKEIVRLNAQIDEAAASQNRIESRVAALRPWQNLDVPLEYEGGAMTVFLCGALPAAADLESLRAELAEKVPASALEQIYADNEQKYVALFAYRPFAEEAAACVKARGFMLAGHRGTKGTAQENIEQLLANMQALQEQSKGWIEEIRALASERELILAAIDAYTQEAGQDQLLSAAGKTEKTVLLTGWVPAEVADAVAAEFESHGCAYLFQAPEENDAPPTATKNNRLVEPFVGVTNMYGTPAYGSVVDPNPAMSIFFFISFGFIMADAAYGILIFICCYLYIKMKRPAPSTKRMITMFMYCGVSTFVAGVLTGGWFGDSVQVVSAWLTGGPGFKIPALWFEPLSDPMKMLTFSLALGGVQIITGMALSGYRMIKQGHWLDAVLDIGTWYVIFAGLGLLAIGSPIGKYVAGGAVAILILTGGRKKKGLGKVVGGFGALYQITGFTSDLLSYSRIMALGLSGGVVAQVVNKISTMAGGIPGIILFIVVFAGGQVFNIAISLLGAYVHSSRLQYIEFFGRFFEDGGRPFKPLQNNTKFVEIIKEDE